MVATHFLYAKFSLDFFESENISSVKLLNFESVINVYK